jgi:hypothetical protein
VGEEEGRLGLDGNQMQLRTSIAEEWEIEQLEVEVMVMEGQLQLVVVVVAAGPVQ